MTSYLDVLKQQVKDSIKESGPVMLNEDTEDTSNEEDVDDNKSDQ